MLYKGKKSKNAYKKPENFEKQKKEYFLQPIIKDRTKKRGKLEKENKGQEGHLGPICLSALVLIHHQSPKFPASLSFGFSRSTDFRNLES